MLTIEHVLPQTVDPASNWAKDWPDEAQRAQWTHRLANLLPLTQKRNSQAQNFDFDKKKAAYFGGTSGVPTYALTVQVLVTRVWTPEILAQRQRELIHLLAEKWDL